MRDFKDLLRRYNASFEVTETSRGFYNTPVAEIDFDGIYDYEKDKLVRPYINFQLPNYINPN